MDEDFFRERLLMLRMRKNVSAREMSLAIGQNASYINRIENGKTLPSMQAFFYICEYLGIRPAEFFDEPEKGAPKQRLAYKMLCELSDTQFESVFSVIREMSAINRRQ